MVADSHHLDEDPDPHLSKIRIRNRIKVERGARIRNKVKRGIRIRVKEMRIRNPEKVSQKIRFHQFHCYVMDPDANPEEYGSNLLF